MTEEQRRAYLPPFPTRIIEKGDTKTMSEQTRIFPERFQTTMSEQTTSLRSSSSIPHLINWLNKHSACEPAIQYVRGFRAGWYSNHGRVLDVWNNCCRLDYMHWFLVKLAALHGCDAHTLYRDVFFSSEGRGPVLTDTEHWEACQRVRKACPDPFDRIGNLRTQALAKLTLEEKRALGLSGL
jgi:hypothetical protein